MKLVTGPRVGECALYVTKAEYAALMAPGGEVAIPPEVAAHVEAHHPIGLSSHPWSGASSGMAMLYGLRVFVIPKLSARGRRALELIQVRPNTMAWPGQFADAFWSDQPDWRGNPAAGHEAVILQRRNKVGAPVAAWMAAGYLGRLRRAGLIEGGHWLRGGGRDALRLTDLGHLALREARR